MFARRLRNRRKVIKQWLLRLTVMLMTFLTCCYLYAAKIEPNWVEVVPIDIAIPNLSSVFDGFKLVQISDLHASYAMPQKRLDRFVQIVNQQQPDVIVITGDIITKHRNFNTVKLEHTLRKLISKSGTLAVLGNHDHWPAKIVKLKKLLINSNIANLNNEVYLIKRATQQLAIAGIDDPYWGHPDLKKVIAHLPSGFPAILLVHEPDYIGKSAKTHRFALQLSGHSHGGQIRLPFFKPLALPTGGRKYFIGLNQLEDTMAYTNRGLGMTNLPLRFNSRPEITVFTLHPKE